MREAIAEVGENGETRKLVIWEERLYSLSLFLSLSSFSPLSFSKKITIFALLNLSLSYYSFYYCTLALIYNFIGSSNACLNSPVQSNEKERYEKKKKKIDKNSIDVTIYKFFSTISSLFTLFNTARDPGFVNFNLRRTQWVILTHTPTLSENSVQVFQKKDMNWNSHIASSPISQSSFFKGVRYLVLASSQRKLRGYIEFL